MLLISTLVLFVVVVKLATLKLFAICEIGFIPSEIADTFIFGLSTLGITKLFTNPQIAHYTISQSTQKALYVSFIVLMTKCLYNLISLRSSPKTRL
ncbi:Uncharacterised protein [Helicobacter fennelliae]|uniref:Uncharacterized protein n=2 Tax=Helicobacter fennelliae TaxID=215 RepID=T1D211_9HELI|nr:hypothetical protein [Helicobacter fennelliae]GAD19271.1 hypothetical protein HFN_0402 [Helicobacter fennelliae MRY12-0050]SQB99049.1 Uncharacterised protein [Helicobacter fennelliae]STP08330.1 Uncharacterised protein [Helicobacter fennelliae]STQ84743.1 Uncharacterised protein [Helicobacter fennelliae]